MSSVKSIAILNIGDEILSGRTENSNATFMARALVGLDVVLDRILILPDSVPEIAEAVLELGRRHDLVFTTGGIGSTPDDLTYEAFSEAFGVPLVLNNDLFNIVKKRHKGSDRWIRRMASPPEGCHMKFGGEYDWPLISFRNFHILPGVPELMRDKFRLATADFPSAPLYRAQITTLQPEASFAGIMLKIMQNHERVKIGSYPKMKPVRRTQITFSSPNLPDVQAAFDEFLSLLEEDLVQERRNPAFFA